MEYLVPEEISLGHYATATALAVEGRTLATEAGRRNSASLHVAYLSMLAALRGDETETKRLAEQAITEATIRRLVKVADIAHRALGLLAFAARQNTEALAVYEKLAGRGSEPGSPVLAVSAIPDHIEAAVRAGAVEQVRPLLDTYLTWVRTIDSAELRALAARATALLAGTSDEANAQYQEALRWHAETGSAFDHARTELLYGEFLRRERQRVQARTHLRSALDTFSRLGTPIWAERAQLELRATGETVRKRAVNVVDALTPQELQIAQAVGAGATNREVAAQLFISPRTVDYHLRKVFHKLGITSRRELMRMKPTGNNSDQRQTD